MARFAGTAVEFPEIRQVVNELKARFHPSVRAKFLGAAVRAAAKPATASLKRIVRQDHKRVTGNLAKSIDSKVKSYKKSGNAVGLVGFTKAGQAKPGQKVKKGKNNAYHAGLITFGTKERRTKGRIASSYRTRGAFTLLARAKRGKSAGKIRTSPKYPKAFFASAAAGQRVSLGSVKGSDPIQKALQQSQSLVRRELKTQMSDIVERAARYLAKRFPPRNT